METSKYETLIHLDEILNWNNKLCQTEKVSSSWDSQNFDLGIKQSNEIELQTGIQ